MYGRLSPGDCLEALYKSPPFYSRPAWCRLGLTTKRDFVDPRFASDIAPRRQRRLWWWLAASPLPTAKIGGSGRPSERGGRLLSGLQHIDGAFFLLLSSLGRFLLSACTVGSGFSVGNFTTCFHFRSHRRNGFVIDVGDFGNRPITSSWVGFDQLRQQLAFLRVVDDVDGCSR